MRRAVGTDLGITKSVVAVLGGGDPTVIPAPRVYGLDKSAEDETVVVFDPGGGTFDRDAAAHAEEDRRRREQAEARNNADALVYGTERLLAEHESVTGTERDQVQAAVAEVKAALEGDDLPALRAHAAQRLQTASSAFDQVLSAADGDVVEAEIVDEEPVVSGAASNVLAPVRPAMARVRTEWELAAGSRREGR